MSGISIGRRFVLPLCATCVTTRRPMSSPATAPRAPRPWLYIRVVADVTRITTATPSPRTPLRRMLAHAPKCLASLAAAATGPALVAPEGMARRWCRPRVMLPALDAPTKKSLPRTVPGIAPSMEDTCKLAWWTPSEALALPLLVCLLLLRLALPWLALAFAAVAANGWRACA